jgi:hypothetical protein
VSLPEDLARGAAENTEIGSVLQGVLDSEGKSAKKPQISNKDGNLTLDNLVVL